MDMIALILLVRMMCEAPPLRDDDDRAAYGKVVVNIKSTLSNLTKTVPLDADDYTGQDKVFVMGVTKLNEEMKDLTPDSPVEDFKAKGEILKAFIIDAVKTNMSGASNETLH